MHGNAFNETDGTRMLVMRRYSICGPRIRLMERSSSKRQEKGVLLWTFAMNVYKISTKNVTSRKSSLESAFRCHARFNVACRQKRRSSPNQTVFLAVQHEIGARVPSLWRYRGSKAREMDRNLVLPKMQLDWTYFVWSTVTHPWQATWQDPLATTSQMRRCESCSPTSAIRAASSSLRRSGETIQVVRCFRMM